MEARLVDPTFAGRAVAEIELFHLCGFEELPKARYVTRRHPLCEQHSLIEYPRAGKKRSIDHLPGSLQQAIDLAESSELLRECLGAHLFESLLVNKKIEWTNFRRHVTDYELKRYLPIL